MTQHNDDPMFEAPAAKPPYDEAPPRKGHGCVFYGCIVAAILFVVMIALVVAAYFAAMRWVNTQVETYTDTRPMALPKPQIAPEEEKTLHDRVDAFKKALDENRAATLTLTGDEITALIDEKPEFKDHVVVEIEGDKVRGEISLPLSQIQIPGIRTRGRYLNGKGTFRVSLQNDLLLVTLDSLEVKGRPVPDQFMQGLRQQNLAKDAYNDPHNAEFLRKLDSIEVKDGRMTIKSKGQQAEGEEKTRHETAEGGGDQEKQPPEGDTTPKKVAPDEEKPEGEAPKDAPAPRASRTPPPQDPLARREAA